jgi:hypothetical protein
VGKIKLVSKNTRSESSDGVKKKFVEHIEECESKISEYITQNIELIDKDLDNHSFFETSGFNSDLDCCPSHLCCRCSYERNVSHKREFPMTDLYKKLLIDIDKSIMQIYNEGFHDDLMENQLRYKLDVIANTGCETLVCLMLRRLIGFCKVITLYKYLENMQLSPQHIKWC